MATATATATAMATGDAGPRQRSPRRRRRRLQRRDRNDEDDDCDGRSDEGETICAQELPFANAICASDDEAGARCELRSCLDGYLQCEGDVGCATPVSATNCGVCGRTCGENETCLKKAGETEFDCSTDGCDDEAPALCDGTCTDLSSSLAHCGACTVEPNEIHACGSAADHGMPACEDGACDLNCVGSYRSCDDETPEPGTPEYANGCEVDTNTSVLHCGRCDNPCPTDGPHTEAYCEQGMCKTRCEGVYLDCDDEIPGCEIKADTAAYCYSCNVACSGLSNACCANKRACGAVGCLL